MTLTRVDGRSTPQTLEVLAGGAPAFCEHAESFCNATMRIARLENKGSGFPHANALDS